MTRWTDYDKIFYEFPCQSIVIENNLFIKKIKNLNLQGKKCLDFGCGSGNWIKLYLENNADVTGVDISLESIEKCKNLYPDSSFYVLEKSGDLPFEKNCFDIIIASWVMQEIYNDDDFEKCLFEISKVLKRNGEFFVVNNVYPDPGERILLNKSRFGDVFSNNDKIPKKMRFFCKNTMTEIMKLIGLECKETIIEEWSTFEIYKKL